MLALPARLLADCGVLQVQERMKSRPQTMGANRSCDSNRVCGSSELRGLENITSETFFQPKSTSEWDHYFKASSYISQPKTLNQNSPTSIAGTLERAPYLGGRLAAGGTAALAAADLRLCFALLHSVRLRLPLVLAGRRPRISFHLRK